MIFFLELLSLSILLTSCVKNEKVKLPLQNVVLTELQIPDTIVNTSELKFDRMNSSWLLDGKPFSGYAIEYFDEVDRLKAKTGILNGKKQNQDSIWYENGNLKQSANYHHGKLHGEKKYWLSNKNHSILSHLSYKFGKPHGEQITWYPTGEPHKKLYLQEGKEEGIQQAFRKNGDLYANYEARNGRIFGLKKASLCFGLEDQKISIDK